MVVIGIDAHKRTHTAVIVDANGRQLATKTCGATSKDHLALLRWAARHGTAPSDRHGATGRTAPLRNGLAERTAAARPGAPRLLPAHPDPLGGA